VYPHGIEWNGEYAGCCVAILRSANVSIVVVSCPRASTGDLSLQTTLGTERMTRVEPERNAREFTLISAGLLSATDEEVT